MEHTISLSTTSLQSHFKDEQILRMVRDAGVNAMDWDLTKYTHSLYQRSEDEICSYFENLRKQAEGLGLYFGQTHGRLNAYCNDPEADAQNCRWGQLDCMATRILNARYSAFHSLGTMTFGVDADPEFMRSLNTRMFSEYLRFAKENNVTIATETFGSAGRGTPECPPPLDFFGNAEEFLRSYREISALCGTDHFAICVDSGHTNLASHFPGQPSPADLIRKAGSAVKILHLHDNDALSDQHKCPRTGNIDWFDLLDALDEIGYQGTYNMEVSFLQYGSTPEMVTAYVNFCVKVMKTLLAEHGK